MSRSIADRTLATPHGEAAYKVVETLVDAGHDAWWVGGCVRDMLLGTVPHDIDIGTSALPEEIRSTFHSAEEPSPGLGSMRVSNHGQIFEVTTFREDDEASDGRHPESVTFGDRQHDAKRRDFTVNALYWHPISHELYDPFGGEADLQERLIRFIGDPGIRIAHDALRILRAVRFRAVLDGQYHPDTYAALRETASHVSVLSGSRVLEELQKMLLGPRPPRALEDLWELRVMEEVLPELSVCKGVAQPKDYHREGDVWEHILRCAASFKPEHGIDVRLAALFHDCGKAVTFSLKERIRFDGHATASAELAGKALDRLQCPARRREKICWLIKHHMMMNLEEMPPERKAHWYFHPWFGELLHLFWLDIAGTEPAHFELYDGIVRDYHTFLDAHPRPEKPLLDGQEVMDILGLRPGEQVGEILRALHEAQTKGEVRSKAEARAFLTRFDTGGTAV